MKYIVFFLLMSVNYIYADEKKDSSETKKLSLPLISYMFGVNYSNVSHDIKDISTISNMSMNFSMQFIIDLDSLESNISSIIFRDSFYYTDINYTISNRRIDGQKYNYGELNTYVQFAALYKHNIYNLNDNSFYLLTGSYVSFSLENNNTKDYHYFNKKDRNNFEFGLVIGGGYEYKFKTFSLGLEYNFQHALTNMYESVNIKNRVHFIYLTYTRNFFNF